MNTARDAILQRLKAPLKGIDRNIPAAEPATPPPPADRTQQLAQFIHCLEANHAQVITLRPPQVAATICRELAQRDINQLLCAPSNPYREALSAELPSLALPLFDFELESRKQWLFEQVPAALGVARCAIAATGTIVVWPDQQEPRSLSLIPPLHIALVDSATLYPDFASLLTHQQWDNGLPANVLLISGPSKTADIQQTLAYGAHGPKELIVLLLEAE